MARQSPIIGEQGQQKIARTKLTIVGCGGNGSMFAYAAALAGFRKMKLIDPDKLEVHNLNRFVLGGIKDIGRDKVSIVKSSLQSFFPDMEIRALNADIKSSGTWELASDCNWLLDATDNDEIRHFLQQRCGEAGIPMISIASGFTLREGQLLGGCRINRVGTNDPCLECQILDHQPMEQLPVSLVTLNLVAASMTLDMLLREITGYAASAQDSMQSINNSQYNQTQSKNVNFILFDLINRTLITERIIPSSQCLYCRKAKDV
ncbi:ThiF family adenylyltransferase [Candidatus Bathyarchaeota archaeon]|nr:ThiF family adenylyltransferase [Candidatus Bathyarchaeota archaeon]